MGFLQILSSASIKKDGDFILHNIIQYFHRIVGKKQKPAVKHFSDLWFVAIPLQIWHKALDVLSIGYYVSTQSKQQQIEL